MRQISLGINQSGSNCSRVPIVTEFLQNECFLSCSDYYWLSYEEKAYKTKFPFGVYVYAALS
jgi:hypothetical protein